MVNTAPLRLTALLLLVGGLLLGGCGERPPAPPPELDAETAALVAEAEVLLDRQEYRRALALADSAARRMPRTPEPEFLRGLILSRTLKWDEAQAAYERVAELDPDFPGVWNNLGNNAVWQASYQEALGYFERELENEPAPVPWASMGRVHRELGNIDSARYAFEKAIELDSTYLSAYVSYAKLMEDEGEYDRALAIAEQAAGVAPNSVDVEYLQGALLARVGRVEEAVERLEVVTEAWPWHTESHYKLGQLLQRLGREAEAQEVLTEAEKLWKLQADVTTYQKTVNARPDDPYAHAALASAYRMAGRYNEALRTYKVALALEPGNVEFLNNMASLHFLQEDTLGAIRTYHRLLDENPKMVEAWANLGVLYALSGEKARARQAWQNALVYRPNDPRIRTYLAKLDTSG